MRTLREALAARRNRRESMTLESRIAWWTAWCRAGDDRLASSERPFGATRSAGTLSGFALGGAQALPGVEQAKAFVSGLVQIQTDKVRSIEYCPEVNCADLASGEIFLDPGIVASCRFRPDASPTERLDILAGLALHEAGHHQFSSRDLCAQARTRGELFFQLFNLLDDEVLEMRLAQGSPGYGDYLRATRHYMFGDAYRQLVTGDLSLLSVIVLFVRYPCALTWSAVAPWITELERIRAILSPFPQTGADAYRAAEDIHRLLADVKGPLPSQELTRFLEQLADHHLVPVPGRQRTLPPRRASARERASGQRGSGLRRRHTAVSLPSLADSHAQATWDVTWEKPGDDRAQYESDRKTVLPQLLQLRRAIARTQTRKDATASGKRSGQLDRRKLHSLPSGNARVFQRKENAASGLTIVLLIDESGSMVGAKVDTARRVAILFREALASQPDVELFIYGHTADDPPGTTNILSYCGPRQRGSRYSLGAIQSRGNNRDGVAIGAVARDVVRHARYQHIVLIVISDGAPHASEYIGPAALEHTRKVVRGLRLVHVSHVGIETAVAGTKICDAAFSFTSLPQLVRQMRQLLEKLLSQT